MTKMSKETFMFRFIELVKQKMGKAVYKKKVCPTRMKNDRTTVTQCRAENSS